MPIDFRREHQVAWARAEAERLRVAYGEAITVLEHASSRELTRGDRLLTISDPGRRGVAAAVCVTQHSEEGSFWRVELRPIVEDDVDVPPTKAVQQISLEMRYNTCVHATWDQTLGPRSGEDGWPDLAEGVGKIMQGDVRVHRRGSFGGQRVPRYASLTIA